MVTVARLHRGVGNCPAYPRASSCLRVTLTACSRGVFPFVSSHDCNFATGNSWVVGGDSTVMVNRVAGPTSANAKPDFLNSAMTGGTFR